MIVSVTSAGDVFFRINLQDGYQILDQTRLLMRYTSEINSRSRNMTSEQAFVNASNMFLEVPRSRVPYPRFRVQVALQVGNEVGQFVSDDEMYGKHISHGCMFNYSLYPLHTFRHEAVYLAEYTKACSKCMRTINAYTHIHKLVAFYCMVFIGTIVIVVVD